MYMYTDIHVCIYDTSGYLLLRKRVVTNSNGMWQQYVSAVQTVTRYGISE
jgi:hypothetical protein